MIGLSTSGQVSSVTFVGIVDIVTTIKLDKLGHVLIVQDYSTFEYYVSDVLGQYTEWHRSVNRQKS